MALPTEKKSAPDHLSVVCRFIHFEKLGGVPLRFPFLSRLPYKGAE